MNYYLDTEFVEGTQDKKFLGIKYANTKPTIDLISIGVVSGDGREYYAVSKDFNVEEAWWREDKPGKYWIRENILRPIFNELLEESGEVRNFNPLSLRKLLDRYGKTNKQIALEVEQYMLLREKEYPDFCSDCGERDTCYTCQAIHKHNSKVDENQEIKVYGFYSSYDWVVFCQLYGLMMNLPKGLPWYCRDLKQTADDIHERTGKNTKFSKGSTQHNALADAKWNKEFHNFLKSLK